MINDLTTIKNTGKLTNKEKNKMILCKNPESKMKQTQTETNTQTWVDHYKFWFVNFSIMYSMFQEYPIKTVNE